MKKIIIIPARINSERLPEKPLRLISNKPMINWTYDAALKTSADLVKVATDSKKIFSLFSNENAVMTSSNHISGTDRVHEAVSKIGLKDNDVIINLQGDEPFIDPKDLNNLFDLIAKEEVKMANKLLFHQSITLDPKVSSLNTPQADGPTPSGELECNTQGTCHSQAQTAAPASQETHTEIVSDDFDSPITTANFQRLRQSLNQFPDVDYVRTFSSQIIEFLKSKQNAHVDPSQTASLFNIIDITLPSLSDERFVQLNSHLGNMLPASGSETGSARISRVASAYQTEINSTTDTVNLDNIYTDIHQELVSVMIAITTFQSDFDIDITPLINVVKSAPVKASTRISGYEASDFLSRSQDPVKICFFVLLAYTGYLIGTRLEDNELIAQTKDKITTFHSQLNQVTSSVRHNFSAMTGINSNQQAVEVVKKIVDKTNSTSVQNTYN